MKRIGKIGFIRHGLAVLILGLITSFWATDNTLASSRDHITSLKDPVIAQMVWDDGNQESNLYLNNVVPNCVGNCIANCVGNCNLNCPGNCNTNCNKNCNPTCNA